jgi:hypothetical protein
MSRTVLTDPYCANAIALSSELPEGERVAIAISGEAGFEMRLFEGAIHHGDTA